ncbi:hypothetical protein THMIRHAM_14430 [Thiomicrorhabdus immobilis]|uniref:Diguanylate cyclase n=1 Tax=Thiomicrorhabdus immobilis TaxID=2791037 RepID=A0ABM7ME29_9GAMM|nr:hypothetical protein THMIRHAM_14430 [Thiomicrorhabdus immobilis]
MSAWYTLSPFVIFEDIAQAIPWHSEHVVIAIFLILWLISLLSPRITNQLHDEIKQQAKEHKQAIKSLQKEHQEENCQIQQLMHSEQFAFWEWNIKTNEVQFSPQWKKMIGLADYDALNNLRDLQQRVHPKDEQAVQHEILKVLSGKQKLFECTHRVQHEDGHYIWVHDKGQVFEGADGHIEKLFAIRLDVSEQKWIESELEIDSILIEHASEGIAVAREDMKILHCNKALSQTLKKTKEQLENSDLIDLVNSLQNKPDDSIVKALETQGFWRGELSLFDDKNEILLASRVSIKKIFHDTTQTINYSFIHSDITDLKRTQTALDTLANVDSVTGLANRHKLYNILETALKSEHEVTLMFLDLDNFKNVNDSLGHDIGDLLLKAVGKEIRKLIPSKALLARVGGDEFVFYYEQGLSSLTSTEIAQRITDRLKQPFHIKGHEIRIGSSIGIAHYPQQSFDRQSLLKASDMAMYHAKRAGKGQFCEFSDHLDEDDNETT